MFRRLQGGVLILLLSGLAQGAEISCLCPPPNYQKNLAAAKTIFIGRIVEVKQFSNLKEDLHPLYPQEYWFSMEPIRDLRGKTQHRYEFTGLDYSPLVAADERPLCTLGIQWAGEYLVLMPAQRRPQWTFCSENFIPVESPYFNHYLQRLKTLSASEEQD